ncbi:MAG: hypothetical protein GXC73_18035 [Chitinophagaceae bacterium]|nr:hypothetical protein [Chitinophagaceae bacterium]
MNVRIEVTRKEKELVGVISTRGFEKNTAYGCDYIVAGQIVNDKLVLTQTSVQRAIKMNDCVLFNSVELVLDKTDTAGLAKAQWFWTNDSKEKFRLKKKENQVSEIAKEEIDDAERKRMIKKEYQEKGKQLQRPKMIIIDHLQVSSKMIVLTISPVEKDPKATLSASANGEIVARDFDLAKNVLTIKLEDIGSINRVVFLNSSAKEEKLDIKITFQQGKKKKKWITSLEAKGNALLLLTNKNDNWRMEGFHVY